VTSHILVVREERNRIRGSKSTGFRKKENRNRLMMSGWPESKSLQATGHESKCRRGRVMDISSDLLSEWTTLPSIVTYSTDQSVNVTVFVTPTRSGMDLFSLLFRRRDHRIDSYSFPKTSNALSSCPIDVHVRVAWHDSWGSLLRVNESISRDWYPDFSCKEYNECLLVRRVFVWILIILWETRVNQFAS
jgi:hypothetical protein